MKNCINSWLRVMVLLKNHAHHIKLLILSTSEHSSFPPTYRTDDACTYSSQVGCEASMCRTCDRFGTCQNINATKYKVREFGMLKSTMDMQAEIYARGPIVCSMYAHSEPFEKYTGGVITESTVYNYTTHGW
jgi:hypothetical protein